MRYEPVYHAMFSILFSLTAVLWAESTDAYPPDSRIVAYGFVVISLALAAFAAAAAVATYASDK